LLRPLGSGRPPGSSVPSRLPGVVSKIRKEGGFTGRRANCIIVEDKNSE
jgi:hypothetical protein